MNNDMRAFYFRKYLPLWNAYFVSEKENTKAAEAHFVDMLKLIVSLSIGLLAFVAVLHDTVLLAISKEILVLILVGFFAAILFAVFSFISLALHYKNYADNASNKRKELDQLYAQNKLAEIEQKIQKNKDRAGKKKGAGWQILTIILGVVSFISFFVSIIALFIKFSFKQ